MWLSYCGLVVVLNLFLMIYANPKWGRNVVFVPLTVNASIGSITVMSARGLGCAKHTHHNAYDQCAVSSKYSLLNLVYNERYKIIL